MGQPRQRREAAGIASSPELSDRLRARLAEIEDALLVRMASVGNSAQDRDPEYRRGLRGAVRTALDHALRLLEGEEFRPDSIPPELSAQARFAARLGVSLDTVLRRYLAGHTLFCDYLLQEASRPPALPGPALQRALRAEAALLDQAVVGVTDAYNQELEHSRQSRERRRAKQVKRMLAGEPLDALDLGYDLDFWHLGVVALGQGAAPALRELATALDRRLLLVRPGGREIWAWLGGNRRMAAEELATRAASDPHSELVLAVGEPGRGAAGWRLTHHQAKAALPVGVRGRSQVVSYSDVALVASVLNDEVLARSLIELYLAPLAEERDEGAILRETLGAYFSAGRNVASTAAALGVSRQTVNSRLRTVEERIGSPLRDCATELETALRLWGLGVATPMDAPSIRQPT